MQAGQDFGIVVVLQTDAAHQELLVYLTHHRAGAAAFPLSHRERHSNEETEASQTTRERQKEGQSLNTAVGPSIPYMQAKANLHKGFYA